MANWSVFSQLNLINTDKRNSLSNDALNDLLAVNIDKVPLKDFCPDTAIDLWWNAKTRKPSHGPRKRGNPRKWMVELMIRKLMKKLLMMRKNRCY